jgi:uncharacterized membrane protein
MASRLSSSLLFWTAPLAVVLLRMGAAAGYLEEKTVSSSADRVDGLFPNHYFI